MKTVLRLILCVLLGLGLLSSGTNARTRQEKLNQSRFIEVPRAPLNPPEIGGSMLQTAAATTVQLGWWQFDTPQGAPTLQGWTVWEPGQVVTQRTSAYFHVDGNVGGCTAINPIDGNKSMWCGQWVTTAVPWCGWQTLPGYGNSWHESLEATINAFSVHYSIQWESEPGYDNTTVEWYDETTAQWVPDPTVNGGWGVYNGGGGPVSDVSSAASAGIPVDTNVRFHFSSDWTGSDEDGFWDSTLPGAVILDNLQLDGGGVETWEGEACLAHGSTDGKWITGNPGAARSPAGFGQYAGLVLAALVVQEDPCAKPLSNLIEFFDNPAVTNYACGGWPLQGAMPYGPQNGLYMHNEVWSPFVPITGSGSEYILSVLVYRDLPLDNLQFYTVGVRTRGLDGCPRVSYGTDPALFYGGHKDWFRAHMGIGTLVPPGATHIAVSVGAVDMCGAWCGIYGTGSCHSHAPLIDQVRLVHVGTFGPQWGLASIYLFQDNFPELGGISSSSYTRCDMACNILPLKNRGIVPGDSLIIGVTDAGGLAGDNTGGRVGNAVYLFVRVTDRFGNPVAGKSGYATQSPDIKAHAGDHTGLIRWPLVAGVAPVGWDAYRFDRVYTPGGSRVPDRFCADLKDLAAGPDGPPYHPNENWEQNTGVFAPGDVIHYFIGAKNLTGTWSYVHRTLNGSGYTRSTNSISEAMASPMEWSVLPDAGRNPGDAGDILFVDDADDRGGPAQLYFDFAFRYMNIEGRVDRFDVLGPSSMAGNSLESRVKNIASQMIGDPIEIYQKVLWNTSDLEAGLMGDGGTSNWGSSAEKSNDFGLAEVFLRTHPDNPGWAYWGDDVVQDWSRLVGLNAVNVKSIYMNHTLTSGDQKVTTGVVSPRVLPASPEPPYGSLRPTESFYAFGGCPTINDFDVPGQAGASFVSHRYNNASTGQTAALSQWTSNGASSIARFFLAGFGFDFIRDNDLNGVPDYVKHLCEVLRWFENVIDEPTGIEPEAFVNNLGDNYPNPFNPETTVRYSVAETGRVTLRIYSAGGEIVRGLVDEQQSPRADGFSVIWDGNNNEGRSVASGVYFAKLTAKNFSQTKKMVLVR